MLTVELQTSPEGQRGYHAVASLTVFADGTVKIDDPDHRVPFEVTVPIKDSSGSVRKLSFDEDPATWARNLNRVLRTGYLIPVVTVDDEN